MAAEKEYRALNGLDWVDKDGNSQRSEPGDKMTKVPDNVLRHEHAAGNVEEWVERQTENVRNPEEGTKVYGVMEDKHGVLQVIDNVE